MTKQQPSEKYDPKIDSGNNSLILYCTVLRLPRRLRERVSVCQWRGGHRNTHSRSRSQLILEL